MSTLFISHKSSERDNLVATELMARLKELNHNSLFLDLDEEKGIVGGRSWEQTLYRNVRACRAVIALLSNDYLRSHWCFAELALARMEGKHLIPLEIEPLDDKLIPQILTGTQRIKLHTDPETSYTRLFKSLEESDLLGEEGDWDPKQSPYLGLSTFEEKHAPLFFGRDDGIRVGIELLNRGAPGLVMVLGSSGSGKSSLVRAGIVPRLRRQEDNWLVVGPFRPHRDPLAELAEALAKAYRRYAPEEAEQSGSRLRLRKRLGAGAETMDDASDSPEPLDADVRVRRLLDQLEELSHEPPAGGGSPLRSFLHLSLGELREICAGKPVGDAGDERRAGPADLVEIADELRRASGKDEARVLLVVDQFEELLGHGASGHRPNRFLDMLREAVEIPNSPVMALGTMRSDFLGLFQQNRELLGIDYEQLSVGPMSEDELTKVITKPAQLGALTLDEGLANLLLKDTGTPDALPLLSFTLQTLWEKRDDNGRLRLDQYEQLGGLQGAIAREAQAILDRHREQEDGVKRVFLDMARLTEDGNYARKSLDLEDVPVEIQEILNEFVDRRLLVAGQDGSGEPTVEVAHEALFRSWPPLVAWLDENKSEHLLKAQLTRDADAWNDGGCGTEVLWRGGRLQQANELMRKSAAGSGGRKSSLEAEFVRAGVWRRRRFRLFMGASLIAIVIVLTALMIDAKIARKEADVQANLALARQLMAQAALQKETQLERAVLFSIESTKRDPSSEASRFLSEAVTLLPLGGSPIRHDGIVNAVAFSSDSRLLATASDDETVKLVNVVGGQETGPPLAIGHRVMNVAFSPRQGYLAAATYGGTALLWRLPSREVLWETNDLVEGGESRVLFTGDGTHLAAFTVFDASVIVFGIEAQKVVHRFLHGGPIYDAVYSPDNRLLVTVGGTQAGGITGPGLARVFDTERRSTVHKVSRPAVVRAASFSPDGHHLALASEDRTVSVWDTRTWKRIETLEHDGKVEFAAFAPDGSELATVAGNDILLWDTTSWQKRRQPTASDELRGLVFGPWRRSALTPADSAKQPEGSRFASFGGAARFAQIWHPASGREALRPHHEESVVDVAFSPDGRYFATASRDKTARIWEAAASGASISLDHPAGVAVNGIRFSPVGRRVATAGEDQKARIWDAETGLMTLELPHDRPVRQIEFSPDGRLVATMVSFRHNSSPFERTVHIWDASTGADVNCLLHEGEVSELAFSADGRHIATSSSDGGARLWLVETGESTDTLAGRCKELRPAEPLQQFAPSNELRGLALSPDGRFLGAISGSKGASEAAVVWDAKNGSEIFRRPVAGEERTAASSLAFRTQGDRLAVGLYDPEESTSASVSLIDTERWKNTSDLRLGEPVWEMRFSRDGRRLATGRVVWSTESPEKLATVTADAFLLDLEFSPDGSHLATAGADGKARVWNIALDREAFAVSHGAQPVTQIDFSPDGKFLATSGKDGSARISQWRTDELVAEACRRLTRNLRNDEWRWLPAGQPRVPTCTVPRP